MSSETMQEFIDGVEARLTPREHDDAHRLADEARQKLATLYTAQSASIDKLGDLHPFQAGAVTDEWIQAVVRDQSDREHRTAAINLLKRFIAEADNRAQLAQPDTNKVLAEYHKRLTELLAAAADVVAELGSADTPTKAIAADLGPQWKRLALLADDYELLRKAQFDLMTTDVIHNARPQLGGDDRVNDLTVRNLDEIWPTWRQPNRTPGRTIHVHSDRVDRLEPWPEDRLKLLIWLVTSDAKPWIPTVPKLRSLWRTRSDRINGTAKPLGQRPNRVPIPGPTVTYGKQIQIS